MGSYALNINDYATRLADKDSFIQATGYNYDGVNKYNHEELLDYNLKAADVGSFNFRNGEIVWNEGTKEHYYLAWAGSGGPLDFAKLSEGADEWEFVKQVTSPQVITPSKWAYSPKYNTYYGIGAGMAEYDADTMTYTQRGITFISNAITYDTKRDRVISTGQNPSAPANFLIQSFDPSAPTIDDQVHGAPYQQFVPDFIGDTGTTNQTLFLDYSEWDDKIYWAYSDTVYVFDYATGLVTVALTSGANEVMGWMIPKGEQYAYMLHEDGADVYLSRVDLSNYSIITSINLGSGYSFATLHYVTKSVMVIVGTAGQPISVFTYDKLLTNNKVYRKNLYENAEYDPQPNAQIPYSTALYLSESTTNAKQFPNGYALQQYYEPLSDQHDVHIPTRRSAVSSQSPDPRNNSLMMNIKPIVPYPSVTVTSSEDCCLDELLCEVETKLGKYSCEVTKRSIVGRHFGNMWDKSQMLEAIKWVTEFDCLSCDDVEALRCITSKI